MKAVEALWGTQILGVGREIDSPEDMYEGQSKFWSPKMSHSVIQNRCWITPASFTSSRMKELRQKWKEKLIFDASTGTGIVECLEIIGVGCTLKQFDGLTWLTLTPRFYDRSNATGSSIIRSNATNLWHDLVKTRHGTITQLNCNHLSSLSITITMLNHAFKPSGIFIFIFFHNKMKTRICAAEMVVRYAAQCVPKSTSVSL